MQILSFIKENKGIFLPKVLNAIVWKAINLPDVLKQYD